MKLGEQLAAAVASGCAVHIGSGANFMGLTCPAEGICVIIDKPDGTRFGKHYPSGGSLTFDEKFSLSLSKFSEAKQ